MKAQRLCLAGAVLAAGCAGPNRLSRGLDLRVNQLYVDSPTLAEVLLPVTFVGTNVALAADMCFVNPWYFWNDVRVGRGTAYFYRDPTTPDNEAPAPFEDGDTLPPLGEPPPLPESPPPDVTTPVPPDEVRPHTVQIGDTLASISRRYYGRPHDWKRIYMANQNVLTSPDALRPGQVLAIPPER
jgi:hypothetical protein